MFLTVFTLLLMASCSTPSFEVGFNDIANKKAVRFSSQRDFSFYPDIRLISRCSRLVRGSNHSLRTKSMFTTPYSAAFSKIIIEYAFLGYSDFSYLISQKFAVFPLVRTFTNCVFDSSQVKS